MRRTILTLATAVVMAMSATPAPAMANDGHGPIWTNKVVGADPYDGTVWIADHVLDPASGDLFVLIYNSFEGQPTRVRRVDGASGATLWETGVGGDTSAGKWLTLDPEAQQLTVLDQNAGWAADLHVLATDGSVTRTQNLPNPGEVYDLETNPATGTSCYSSRRTKRTDTKKTGGRRTSWHLRCVDRDGLPVMDEEFSHDGWGEPSRLGLDPSRNRWYVAGPMRRGRTVVLAFDEGRGRAWKRTRVRRSATGHGGVDSLAVDQDSGRVYVGGHFANKKARGTLNAWTTEGHKKVDRSWRVHSENRVDDLEVAPGARRVFALVEGYRGAEVRVMGRNGKLLKKIRQDSRRWDVMGSLDLDPARRQLFVSGVSVAAYAWSGKRLWRDKRRAHYVHGSDYDVDRGRLLVVSSWFDEPGMPGGWVSAWPR